MLFLLNSKRNFHFTFSKIFVEFSLWRDFVSNRVGTFCQKFKHVLHLIPLSASASYVIVARRRSCEMSLCAFIPPPLHLTARRWTRAEEMSISRTQKTSRLFGKNSLLCFMIAFLIHSRDHFTVLGILCVANIVFKVVKDVLGINWDQDGFYESLQQCVKSPTYQRVAMPSFYGLKQVLHCKSPCWSINRNIFHNLSRYSP